jgi:predicted nucleic acid-binding protein
MAGTRVLVDAGPLVAYLNRRDRHHAWSVECWKAPSDPLLVLVERQIVRVDFAMAEHRADVIRLLRKYADQPMSLADAGLVRMAELHDRCQVFTTDRDFRVYRRKGRQVIPLLSPF